MIPPAVSERPWQILGTDVLSLKGVTYLLVVDYFSRYIEVALFLTSQKSSDTIRALKSIFARHGILTKGRNMLLRISTNYPRIFPSPT